MIRPNFGPSFVLRRLLPGLVIAALSIAPALAQDSADAVSGRFRAVSGGAIELADGVKRPISPGRRGEVAEALKLITSGQEVELKLDDGRVVGIRALEPTFEVDATYDRLIPSAGAVLIRLRQGPTFQVPPDKVSQVRNQILVIESGAYVRLVMYGKSVLAIKARIGAMPPARLSLSPELAKSLKGCQAKHIVSYNGKDERYEVISVNDQVLVLQAVTPKGAPPGKRIWLPKGFLKDFTNHSIKPKVRRPGVTSPEGEDQIAKLGLEVGDTVGLGLRRGVVSKLDPEAIVLRLWEKNRFVSTRRFERAEVADKIKRRELRSSYSIAAFGGELTILAYRQRIVNKDQLIFRARLTHDVKGYVLAGAGLVGTVDGDLERPAALQRVELPPILAGETYDFEKKIPLVKASIQLKVVVDPELNFISLDTREARRYIAQRLLETDTIRLLSAYDAVVANKDPDLLRVLATRALDEGLSEETRNDVVRVLKRCGEEAATALVELATSDKLRRYTLDQTGAVVQKSLGTSETVYRGLVVELIAKLGPAVQPEHTLGLFELYGRYGDSGLSNRILQTIRTHSDAAVTALIEVASEIGGKDSNEKTARVERAAEVIRSLGADALNPLIRKLMRISLITKAKTIRTLQKTGGKSVRGLIDDAIQAVVDKRREDERRRVRKRIREIADELDRLEGDDPKELEERLRAWLLELERDLAPKNKEGDGKRLIPRVQSELGVVLRKLGRRGEAAEVLVAAAKARGSDKFITKAKRNLAQILVEAVSEELDSGVLRSGQGHCYAKVRVLRAGESLTIDDRAKVSSTTLWAPVKSLGKTAWIPVSLTDYNPGAKQLTAKEGVRPVKELRETIERARRLHGSAAAKAVGAEIQLLTRETYEFARASRHDEVLANLERLEQLQPGSKASEELYWKSWAAVNWIFIALGGSVFLSLIVFGLRLLFSGKAQKIEAPEEYIYYGPDRARRERELE